MKYIQSQFTIAISDEAAAALGDMRKAIQYRKPKDGLLSYYEYDHDITDELISSYLVQRASITHIRLTQLGQNAELSEAQ